MSYCLLFQIHISLTVNPNLLFQYTFISIYLNDIVNYFFFLHYFSFGTLCKSWVNLPLFHFASLFQFYFLYFSYICLLCILLSCLQSFLSCASSYFASTSTMIFHVIVEFTFYLFLLTHDVFHELLNILFVFFLHREYCLVEFLNFWWKISSQFICSSRSFFWRIVFVCKIFLFVFSYLFLSFSCSIFV